VQNQRQPDQVSQKEVCKTVRFFTGGPTVEFAENTLAFLVKKPGSENYVK